MGIACMSVVTAANCPVRSFVDRYTLVQVISVMNVSHAKEGSKPLLASFCQYFVIVSLGIGSLTLFCFYQMFKFKIPINETKMHAKQ